MRALLAWQAWVIFTLHMRNAKIESTGQWEEQVWCAEGRHCCLYRVPLLHPLGLTGALFLKPSCCCHFSCLTTQKQMQGVQLLLSAATATARSSPGEGRQYPSCAAACGGDGQRHAGRSIRTSGLVVLWASKCLRKPG